MIDSLPMLGYLIGSAVVGIGFIMVLCAHGRARDLLTGNIQEHARFIVNKPVGVETANGSTTLRPADHFQIIRENKQHGNIWCRFVSSGEVFIIRTHRVVELIQEDYIVRSS